MPSSLAGEAAAERDGLGAGEAPYRGRMRAGDIYSKPILPKLPAATPGVTTVASGACDEFGIVPAA